MPYDPVRAKDTMAWLRKAELDLGAGATDIAVIPPYLGDAVFHAQQAVEKSLKALLVWYDVPFRKTHDLAELGQRCTDVDPSLESLLRCVAGLTKYLGSSAILETLQSRLETRRNRQLSPPVGCMKPF